MFLLQNLRQEDFLNQFHLLRISSTDKLNRLTLDEAVDLVE